MTKEASGIAVHCAHDEPVDVANLIPNPRNPNKHGDKQVAMLAKIIRHQVRRALTFNSWLIEGQAVDNNHPSPHCGGVSACALFSAVWIEGEPHAAPVCSPTRPKTQFHCCILLH